MSSTKITSKIIEKAEKNASEILENAQKQAIVNKKQIKEQTKKQLAEIKEQTDKDIEEIKHKNELMLRLESRKKVLATKRKVIDLVYDAAEKELSKLDDSKWQSLITRIVVNASETGTEKLRVPQKDRAKYEQAGPDGKTFLASLNDALVKSGKKGQLTMDAEDGKFDGGLVLIQENADINASFDYILNMIREDSENEVASVLFDKER